MLALSFFAFDPIRKSPTERKGAPITVASSGLAQLTRHYGSGPVDACSQPGIELWIGREIQFQSNPDDIEYAGNHKICHVPSVAAEERRLDELLLKNGKFGPQRLSD
jgi:hypothetical protein